MRPTARAATRAGLVGGAALLAAVLTRHLGPGRLRGPRVLLRLRRRRQPRAPATATAVVRLRHRRRRRRRGRRERLARPVHRHGHPARRVHRRCSDRTSCRRGRGWRPHRSRFSTRPARSTSSLFEFGPDGGLRRGPDRPRPHRRGRRRSPRRWPAPTPWWPATSSSSSTPATAGPDVGMCCALTDEGDVTIDAFEATPRPRPPRTDPVRRADAATRCARSSCRPTSPVRTAAPPCRSCSVVASSPPAPGAVVTGRARARRGASRRH